MEPLKDVPAEPTTTSHDSAEVRHSHLAASHRRLTETLRRAIVRTQNWLLEQQHRRGFWCGELQGDTILESEYILLLAWLGLENEPLACKAAQYLIDQQLPSGGWPLYPGGMLDISVSVKAYFALKLTGHDADADFMQRARQAILAHGGADLVNSFTRFYLALLGQIDFEHCPAVPPEAVLLPTWLPMNIYRVSAWSRTILVPLSIMWAYRPVRHIERTRGIRELFRHEPDEWPELRSPGLEPARGWFTWDRCFRLLDRALKWLERHGIKPLRWWALDAAERWMTSRFVASDGLGAIFPPMIWSIVALKCRGFKDESPEVRYCHEQLRLLVIEDDRSARLQPCKSPVWDTALTMRALAGSGVQPNADAVERSVRWLLDKEVTRRGDWSKTVDCKPGGWFFEHYNEFYPDVDDTAMVLLALREQFNSDAELAAQQSGDSSIIALRVAPTVALARAQAATLERVASAGRRAVRWLRALQNRDGGWGAFDKNNDAHFLCHVPFADHNAMIDPSTPDLTGRVLEAFGCWNIRVGDSAVDRGVEYLRSTQERDGCWQGRWGVNYIYGTWQALAGLAAIGIPPDDPAIVKGAHWLLTSQQSCGGWGESPASYAQPSLRGQGPVTASQTAWALLGLIAAGRGDRPAVKCGIEYLLNTQRDDGTWDEPEFTGTGFPRVFYLRYHMYPIYFPLLALARWQAVDSTMVKAI